jgi:type I restriction enzyme S subunit
VDVKPGYRQTEAGVIPEDWIAEPLGAFGSFKNGINKPAEDFGHGSPFVNLMDVFGIPRAAETAENLGLINSSPAEQQTYELRAGDVLFVRSSVKPEGVGLTTLIPNDLPATVFSGFLIRFRDRGQLAT